MSKMLLLLWGIACAIPAAAQNLPTPLVSQPIDDTKVVTLPGTVHPRLQTAIDRGVVDESTPSGRVLILLNRPPERAAALRQYLKDLHTPGAANYHKWLTPDQIGSRFGAADSDLETVTNWLIAQGFSVAKTSKGRQLIEFTGTAGTLRSAFHSEIHQYSVNGQTYVANATAVKIPAALAPLVKGLTPLNNFNSKPTMRLLGQAAYTPVTHRTTAQWTTTSGSSKFYALAPEDFTTQYDLAPLYKAGINGFGQTIGIINESNIDLSLVDAYHKLFGLASPTPQIVIDGNDPGTISGISDEAYLDVEEAGAVAPGANVLLYISDTGNLFTGTTTGERTVVDPLYMAALRAVDDNQASVLSMSFSNCEGFLLASGNQLWSELWQQAAAQGQTVLVSSGDSGSAGCDNANDQWITKYGPAVNGLASTPWNMAVGGTDFYYSDYATGGASAATLWNQSNDADLGSLKAPLTEQVWDTVYGFNATGTYVQSSSRSIPAGGGGASSCINSAENSTGTGLPFTCSPVSTSNIYGYAKPSWQNVSGVPADGVRDIPDLSLFAAAGENNSAYPICAEAGDCVANASGSLQISLVGGTSASTPAMAGIMALVNQKYGRQGQANFTLYPLSRQVPTAFHDITLGSNNMTCLKGTPGCTLDSNGDGFYSLQKYPAAAGYDLASGLGSIDASVLVNNWNTVSFQTTATTLQISPSTAQHGSDVSVSIDVKHSGGGTPQGSVTIMAAILSAPQSMGTFTLSNGSASGTLTGLPGGTYQVYAQYAGDGVFASSHSDPQTVTISQQSSTVNLYGFYVPGLSKNPAAPCEIDANQSLYETGPLGGSWGPLPSGTTFSGIQAVPVAIVNGAWPSFGSGTGSVTFSVDGTPDATVALNSYGYAVWVPSTLFNAGTHTISATYSGDASYAASMATPYTAIVPTQALNMAVTPAANCQYFGLNSSQSSPMTCSFTAGDDLRVEVRALMTSCRLPTGPVTVNLGSLSQNVTLTPGGLVMGTFGTPEGYPTLYGEAVFKSLPAGMYALSATYAGDANTAAAVAPDPTITNGTQAYYQVTATAPASQPLSSSITFSVKPPSMVHTLVSYLVLSATVTGGTGSTVPPTGVVSFYEDGNLITTGTLVSSGTNSSNLDTGPFGGALASGTYFDLGDGHLEAVYSGDSVYQPSSASESYQFTLSEEGADFLLAPQAPTIYVKSGSTVTTGFNLASLGGFNGAVSLSCSTDSNLITCSLNPATVTVNGQASTTVTVSASPLAHVQTASQRPKPQWPIALGAGVFALFLLRRARKSARWISLTAVLLAISIFGMTGCGAKTKSGSSSSSGNIPITPIWTSYHLVVTGTANGVTHNAVITVAAD